MQSTSKLDLMSNTLEMLQTKSSEAKSQNSMEGLSDSDLKTLLQNFKDLSTDEQHGLITYLKKLEAKEPERVERLRKFVKLGPNNSDSEKAYTSGRVSPFSNREVGANPSQDEMDRNKNKHPPAKKLIDSDDDDDYSFEDVFKAASKNVTDKQNLEEQIKQSEKQSDPAKDLGINLTDAKMIIANLMGQLGAANKSSSPSVNLLGLSSTQNTTPVTNTITSNLINLNTLTSNLDTTKLTNSLPLTTNLNPVPGDSSGYPSQNNINLPRFNQPNYGYQPNNRQYNYDEYNQYQNNQGSNYNNPSDYNPPGMDYGAPGSNMDYGMQQDYHNSYPNQGIPQQRPQFNRTAYPPYDPRQNYY